MATTTDAASTTATPSVVEGSSSLEDEEESLIIPIQNSQLFIEIFADELPSLSVLRQVLLDEQCGGQIWAAAAGMYLHRQQKQQSQEPQKNNSNKSNNNITAATTDAVALLEEALELPHMTQREKVWLQASLGIAHLTAGNETSADECFTAAGTLDTFCPLTWVGKGMLQLQQGMEDQAHFLFQTTLGQRGPDVLPAVLGMAAVLYRRGDYRAAAQHYQRVLKQGGANVRVGLGLCWYQMGQTARARAAFARAMDMDPECVPAMVGAAIIDLSSGKKEQAIKLFSMANLLDHSNAMVQNHLSNHYFSKWTPVTGTVKVTHGSRTLHASQPMQFQLGDPIRIGTRFESVILENDVDDMQDERHFRMQAVWKQETVAEIKVWKKDYQRVFDLARAAFRSTKVPKIQAESLFFMARVYHARNDIDMAAKFYEGAIKEEKGNPDLIPARFGFAQVLVIQGHDDRAIQELELVTKKSQSSEALALLGMVQVKKGNLTVGLANIRKALELDPKNPDLMMREALALQQNKSHYAKALQRYEAALELMPQDEVTTEMYNNMGVLSQETKKYEQSLQYYRKALVALNSTASAVQLANLGKDNARVRHADNDDVLCGYCALEPPVSVQVVTQDENDDRKTVKVASESPLETLQDVIKEGDFVRLGATFATKVISLETSDGSVLLKVADSVPKGTDDKENEAEESVNEPTQFALFVKRENGYLDIPEATTVVFNVARLHEATGRNLAAVEVHRAVIKRNPAYVNSYLRLACIAVDNGALKECSEWLKIAAAVAPGSPEVLTLIGNLHLSLCDWKPAQSVFEGLMGKKVESAEAYALLSMGNIYFATLFVSPERYSKHLEYASAYYKKILTKDALNAYAANGLGTVLAERGDIFKAKEVFNRVREVSEDSIADALFNLGHIYLAQKKHPEALQMYNNFLKRVEDISTPTTSKNRLEDYVDVLLYIAFAYFDWARHTELSNDANAAPADGRYKKAIECLNTAIAKDSPKKEDVLKYNLCMVKLQAANCVLQKLTRNIPRTVEEVESALRGLEESLPVVEAILKKKEEGNRKIAIKTSTLEDFVKHCKANIESAKAHLEDEKKRAEDEAAEREIRRLATEAAVKEEALRKAIKRTEEAKAQEERDRKAELKMKKVEELRQGWQQQQSAEQAAKDKKARKPATSDGGFLVAEDGNDLFADSDDDDIPDPKTPEDKTKKADAEKSASTPADLFGDSDDDDEDAPAASKPEASTDAPKPENAAAATAKELFGDSDEDGSSDEELIKPDSKRAADGDDNEQAKKKQKIAEEEESK